jgi:hypothetical protein
LLIELSRTFCISSKVYSYHDPQKDPLKILNIRYNGLQIGSHGRRAMDSEDEQCEEKMERC